MVWLLGKSWLLGDSLWFALKDDRRLIVRARCVWLLLQNFALLIRWL